MATINWDKIAKKANKELIKPSFIKNSSQATKDVLSFHNVSKVQLAMPQSKDGWQNTENTSKFAKNNVTPWGSNGMTTSDNWTIQQIVGITTSVKNAISKGLIEELGDDPDFATKFMDYTPSQLLVTEHRVVTKKVQNYKIITHCVVSLSFNDEALRRKSFDPAKYPRGVDNILSLLAHGWDYSSKVGNRIWNPYLKGTWRGVDNVFAVAKAEPYDVLGKVVRRYNDAHAKDGIIVKVAPSFYT